MDLRIKILLSTYWHTASTTQTECVVKISKEASLQNAYENNSQCGTLKSRMRFRSAIDTLVKIVFDLYVEVYLLLIL